MSQRVVVGVPGWLGLTGDVEKPREGTPLPRIARGHPLRPDLVPLIIRQYAVRKIEM